MFEENKNNIESDILMRSILSEAQEEVPAHVWDGISAELDKIQAAKVRKPFVLWMKRSAIGVAAAAAVVTGVMIDWNGTDDSTIITPSSDGMIAVVEPETAIPAVPADTAETSEIRIAAPSVLMADAEDEVRKAREAVSMQAEEPESAELTAADEKTADPIRQEGSTPSGMSETSETSAESEKNDDVWTDQVITGHHDGDWGEEETVSRRKARTAITVSGLTGTNSTQNRNPAGPLRRPSISTAPVKTGIRQTSTESTYGLPLSAGVGIKIGLSPKWSLGAGVNYTLLTRKFYGTYTSVSNGSIERQVSSDIRNSIHYIGIPVNAYYSIINRDHVNFYAYAGGAVEKCVSNEYDVLNTSVIHKEVPAGVQFSANAGIGVEFILGKHIGLYIDPSLRYYFEGNQPKSIRTDQPLMLGFEMGFRFNL